MFHDENEDYDKSFGLLWYVLKKTCDERTYTFIKVMLYKGLGSSAALEAAEAAKH